MCSCSIDSASTSKIDSSACGWICIRSSTCRASETSADSSSSTPDSLATSMLMTSPGWRSRRGGSATAAAAGLPAGGADRGRGGAVAGGPPGVCIDKPAGQFVPDDVMAGQEAELEVLDAVEDLLNDLQTALGSGWQVDL